MCVNDYIYTGFTRCIHNYWHLHAQHWCGPNMVMFSWRALPMFKKRPMDKIKQDKYIMNAWNKHVWPYEFTLETAMETLQSVQVKNIPWNEI